MRRLLSILFVFLMLLQAIPMLHFFSSQKEVFLTNIDEEKPKKGFAEKKEIKEYLPLAAHSINDFRDDSRFSPFVLNNYSSPSLESLKLPPDACKA